MLEFEDIHQQIFLPKFYKNLTLPREADSSFGAWSQQNQKTSQFPAVKSDFHETLEGRSADKYLQIHTRGI